MIIVTGGSGFIGSNLVNRLNQLGFKDILIVDQLEDSKQFRNLIGLKYIDIIDPQDFMMTNHLYASAQMIFHLGANTDTTEHNSNLMLNQNYTYSKDIMDWAIKTNIRVIYASSAAVYGDGSRGFMEKVECECPLNIYGFSKYQLDQWVRSKFTETTSQIVGLRFFNVFGPQENHKHKMASVIYQFQKQIAETDSFQLFEGSENFYRDFIYVSDVVDIMIYFFERAHFSGIFNAGTGRADSFLELGQLIQKYNDECLMEPVPFPEHLKGYYQRFTQADLTELQNIGYDCQFTPLEDSVAEYVDILKRNDGYLH